MSGGGLGSNIYTCVMSGFFLGYLYIVLMAKATFEHLVLASILQRLH